MCTRSKIKSKIKSRAELKELLPKLQAAGQKVGFTSGVFDLMHPGHVAYLDKARALCDVLVVALNSDASVRANKGPERPICTAVDRAAVLAGLTAVDYIFVFDERNNNQNISELKPDFYIKAGDYDRTKLSSARLVETYGGRVALVDFERGHSTTKIVEGILNSYSAADVKTLKGPELAAKGAVFLDRDGTLIEHIDYLHEPEKLKLLPGVLDGLKALRQAGFYLVIVTNQPGIGLGYFPLEAFFKVNKALLKECNSQGVQIDKIYFCPHSQAQACKCRKPRLGLIERALAELNIDLSNSFVAGDMASDIKLGRNAGCRTVLLRSDLEVQEAADYVASDFTALTAWILAESKRSLKA